MSYTRIRHQAFNWLFAFVDIASALMVILSLGFWYPNWNMNVRVWKTKKDMAKRKTQIKIRKMAEKEICPFCGFGKPMIYDRIHDCCDTCNSKWEVHE